MRNRDDGVGVGLWNFDVLKLVIAIVHVMFCTSDQTSPWIYEPNVWSSYVNKWSDLTLFIYICFFILLSPSGCTHTFWNSFYVNTVSRVLTCSKLPLLVAKSKHFFQGPNLQHMHFTKSIFFNKFFLCLSLFLVLQIILLLLYACFFLYVCQSFFAGKPKYRLLYKCTLEGNNKWS